MDTSAEFDLCDHVFGLITDPKPRHFPISEYPQPERTVVAVWHFTGIIENSGLGGLLSRDVVGDPGFSLVVDCFERIDTTLAFDAVRTAVEHVRSRDAGVTTAQKRRELWDALPETERDRLDSQFFRASDAILVALASYIHHHGLNNAN